jgi:hypothetical protein
MPDLKHGRDFMSVMGEVRGVHAIFLLRRNPITRWMNHGIHGGS